MADNTVSLTSTLFVSLWTMNALVGGEGCRSSLTSPSPPAGYCISPGCLTCSFCSSGAQRLLSMPFCYLKESQCMCYILYMLHIQQSFYYNHFELFINLDWHIWSFLKTAIVILLFSKQICNSILDTKFGIQITAFP